MFGKPSKEEIEFIIRDRTDTRPFLVVKPDIHASAGQGGSLVSFTKSRRSIHPRSIFSNGMLEES